VRLTVCEFDESPGITHRTLTSPVIPSLFGKNRVIEYIVGYDPSSFFYDDVRDCQLVCAFVPTNQYFLIYGVCRAGFSVAGLRPDDCIRCRTGVVMKLQDVADENSRRPEDPRATLVINDGTRPMLVGIMPSIRHLQRQHLVAPSPKRNWPLTPVGRLSLVCRVGRRGRPRGNCSPFLPDVTATPTVSVRLSSMRIGKF